MINIVIHETIEYAGEKNGVKMYRNVANGCEYTLRVNRDLPDVITLTNGVIDKPNISGLFISYAIFAICGCAMTYGSALKCHIWLTVLLAIIVATSSLYLLVQLWRNISLVEGLSDVQSALNVSIECNRKLRRIDDIAYSLNTWTDAAQILQQLPNDLQEDEFDRCVKEILVSRLN